MIKRILCMMMLAAMMAMILCACAKEAMDDAESMIGDMASNISSGVDSMMGGSSSESPTNPPAIYDETDNPTDGDFGEPNVDDYNDNDSDVVGDVTEEE